MVLFTRLTFNENDWIIPSGHPWAPENQGNTNIAYENQHGFGHEEWLFNVRYNVGGWQYGYIRGLSRVHQNIDRVYLYTVRRKRGERLVYYVGYLNNVEIVPVNWREIFLNVEEAYSSNFPLVIEEVERVRGNAHILDKDPLKPVIRFRIDGNNILDTPRLLGHFPLKRYKRFQPYEITDEILNIFLSQPIDIEQPSFDFILGKASQTDRFNRYVRPSSKAVIRTHSKITDSLELHLSPTYSLANSNISIERSRFHGNIADIVTRELDNSISIYEIKTSLNLRRNIREAVAQLLDYASHSNNTIIHKLVIVSPCELDKAGLHFLDSLNSLIKHKIYYLQYLENLQPNFV